MKICIYIIVLLISSTTLAQSQPVEKNLWQPYRVTERSGAQHVELSGEGWTLGHADKPIKNRSELAELKDVFKTSIPNSVHWSYFKAGKLPHPYYNKNSEKYWWLDEKVWYYRRSFKMPEKAADSYVFLCFEGVDYFSKVWVNDSLVGVHEGMFGGPTVEISRFLKSDNEITVEVRAGNWGNKATKLEDLPRSASGEFDYSKRKGYNPRVSGKIIKPWVISGGSGGEAFFSVGMWQGVRLEVVPKVHMERPFLTTVKSSDKQADLHLSLELLANEASTNLKLHPWNNTQLDHPDNFGQKFEAQNGNYAVQMELLSDGKPVSKQSWKIELTQGRNWLEKDIILANPKLWNPTGLGKADMYDVKITLMQNDKVLDNIHFKHGIRTIAFLPTAGPRTRDRWDNWQFVINGKKVFVKGMNFTPQDILLDLPYERYRWTLEAAKKMGVQLIRIWGGGLLETKHFYDICDELGIMVWQDFPIGNQDTPDYPQDVWEAQVVQNIVRLRNHPSLAIWCGGNEFNAYSSGNATSIGILERNLKIFDPARPFKRTTPDHGAIHVYPDMDPVWYNRSYAKAPWISETGMHSLPEASVFYETVDNKEFVGLGKMWEKTFEKDHPEFIHHFTEYGPGRVPRMLSRASHIIDVADPTIDEISEASQVGAGEFYQVFSEKVQGNYPVTTGLMPWVFKRHWPVIAIQLIDWFGNAGAPYYFLKRTYEPTHVAVDIPRLLWKSGEEMDLPVKVTHARPAAINGAKLTVSVLDDAFKTLWENEKTLQIQAGTSVTSSATGKFKIPAEYNDRFLLVLAELKDPSGKLISRSVYFPRVLSKMRDEAFFKEYTSTPIPWIALDKGPWLKPTITKSPQTTLTVVANSQEKIGNDRSRIKVTVKNTGTSPAFMTKMDISGVKRAIVADDNYFWLAAGEARQIVMDVLWREPDASQKPVLTVKSWNSPLVTSPLGTSKN
ncbi:glycosyl hydrolase 2 galactose-binding domain-containing protein [Dyadobacter sp. CY323]|uniref:glycoside hydrolase family 2 protein n=1 Tax=Dyadobacter sp. CY323 TaxID=2907302 RepID=UPI001F36CAAB|nr:sugar-binding domain-containing protein [Dyadobacter sp. CY323]MCE6991262.1 beta-mannosidase [Dyadobacter sp. CY323]